MSDFAYADEIVTPSSSYREMQDLFEDVYRYVAAVGMCINVPKTKLMSALIDGEKCQAVLLDGESLEDVDKFKYLDLMFITNS